MNAAPGAEFANPEHDNPIEESKVLANDFEKSHVYRSSESWELNADQVFI